MKNSNFKFIALLISTLFISIHVKAQSPEAFNYQAMALNASNMPYENQTIHLQISILETSQNGSSIYVERHTTTTSDQGLFSIHIGTGSVQSGDFSDADWGSENYWINIEADFNGGNNFIFQGSSQMVSVPYAMHAQTVENADDADADPSNELQFINKTGNMVNLSLGGGSFIDEVNDADADPNNELQTLSIVNRTLSLSQSNSTIDLSEFTSPWVKNSTTGTIDYNTPNSLARVMDDNNTLNLSPTQINFLDTSECRSYLNNGSLIYDREITLSPDLKLINPVSGFTKDSIYFDDFDQNHTDISHSMMNKDIAYFYDEIGGQKFEGSIEPYQLDLRINGTEAWGNYDAYGLQARVEAVPGEFNDWELDLKSGIGLYMAENDGNGGNNASLSNQYGIQIGKGITYGIMDDVYTSLDKDSLTFDYMFANGFSSGFSSYGRDQLNMSFQAGSVEHSSSLSPFNLSMSLDLSGDKNSMDLTSNELEFLNPNGGYSFTHVGLDSIHMNKNIGLLYPDIMTLKPHQLLFEDLYNLSFLTSYGLEIKSNNSPNLQIDRINLNPDGLTMINSSSWKNAFLGTDMDANAGLLNLWSGTGDFKLVRLGSANLDNLGGSLELFSSNSGSHAHALLRAQNGKGELSLYGQSSINVHIGSRSDDKGLVQVYNNINNGEASASMYVDDNENGILQADYIVAGDHPGNSSKYPLKTVQTSTFGMNIETMDHNNNWEFFVQNDADLGLYANGNYVGNFDKTTGVYSTISDRRLKQNIRPMESLLPSLLEMKPSKYQYINNNPKALSSIGFIAQDIKVLFPELVHSSQSKEGSEVLTVDYAGFGVIAIKAIQEQQKIINKQNTKIKQLENDMDKLKAMVEAFINQN